jgi:hypothetical protein
MKTQKTKFWITLAIINTAAMIYPITQYLRADSSETQLFAAILLLGVAFLLAITDATTAILVCMQ